MNNINIKNLLNAIRKDRDLYNDFVHKRKTTLEKYIKLMNITDKNIGAKIQFIFNLSQTLNQYVFKNEINITGENIYEEFIKKKEELKNFYK